jgi:hypothetical protein
MLCARSFCASNAVVRASIWVSVNEYCGIFKPGEKARGWRIFPAM